MSASEALVGGFTSRRALAGLAVIAGIGAGIFFQNPAVALLVGLGVRLGLDINPVAQSSTVSKYSLQTAIVLLGVTLGFDRLVSVSADYGYVVAAYVLCTLLLGFVLARLLGIADNEGKLLSSGTAICGGTAIATLAPLMNAKPHQIGVAMALVFLLNVVAIFLFPWIGHWLELSKRRLAPGSRLQSTTRAQWWPRLRFMAMKQRKWPRP